MIRPSSAFFVGESRTKTWEQHANHRYTNYRNLSADIKLMMFKSARKWTLKSPAASSRPGNSEIFVFSLSIPRSWIHWYLQEA